MLYGYLDRGESLLLLALVAGIVSRYLGISQGITLIIISLAGLMAIFFFMAFRPPAEVPAETEEKPGFMYLFVYVIVPKIMWISCAVCTSSLLLYHLESGNEGYTLGLMIHSTLTVGTLVVIGLAAAKGVPGLRSLLPIYFRALPLMLTAVYLLRG